MAFGFMSTTFSNLDGTFLLIIPTRDGDYGHLVSFLKNASEEEIADLLRLVANIVEIK